MRMLTAAGMLLIAGCTPQLPPLPDHPTLADCRSVVGFGPAANAWKGECARRVIHDAFDRAEARGKTMPQVAPPDLTVEELMELTRREDAEAARHRAAQEELGTVGDAIGACANSPDRGHCLDNALH